MSDYRILHQMIERHPSKCASFIFWKVISESAIAVTKCDGPTLFSLSWLRHHSSFQVEEKEHENFNQHKSCPWMILYYYIVALCNIFTFHSFSVENNDPQVNFSVKIWFNYRAASRLQCFFNKRCPGIMGYRKVQSVLTWYFKLAKSTAQ